MKIIYKTYILLAIIIAAATINIFLLFTTASENATDLNAVVSANNLKVTVERVAGLANSIASGNEDDREALSMKINEFDMSYSVLLNGGKINNAVVSSVPVTLRSEYEEIGVTWSLYKENAETIRKESVFNPEVTNAIRYVLEKNGEVVTTSDKVLQELSSLGREYNRHKEIAIDLQKQSRLIGEKTLLISIGEEDHREELAKSRKLFDACIKKLLQVPVAESELAELGLPKETLSPIPRENSDALRTLDPLWEAVQPKIKIVETKSLIAEEFGTALNTLRDERRNLLNLTDNFVNSWHQVLDKKISDKGIVIQGLLGADIVVFFFVIHSIRSSLRPLEILTNAISRVKEGIYGEKIEKTSRDEIGALTDTFNSMSMTIKEKEDEARKIEIAKDEFLAMITHELKTPLVPIQGYSDILLRGHLGDLNKNQKERIEIIKASSASLLSLISDLLDAQKLELRQLRIKKENHNLKNTIEKTIEFMTPQAMADQISITSDLKTDLFASYDDDRIRQVINNLLKNSLKACSPKVGKIEILVEDLQNEVRISVKDNGKGIPKDKQDGLFKKFYQVDTSSTREKGGTGLGLSICKGIVETHGGKIWFESDAGKGALFTFSIPKEQQTKAAV